MGMSNILICSRDVKHATAVSADTCSGIEVGQSVLQQHVYIHTYVRTYVRRSENNPKVGLCVCSIHVRMYVLYIHIVIVSIYN